MSHLLCFPSSSAKHASVRKREGEKASNCVCANVSVKESVCVRVCESVCVCVCLYSYASICLNECLCELFCCLCVCIRAFLSLYSVQ